MPGSGSQEWASKFTTKIESESKCASLTNFVTDCRQFHYPKYKTFSSEEVIFIFREKILLKFLILTTRKFHFWEYKKKRFLNKMESSYFFVVEKIQETFSEQVFLGKNIIVF